MSAAHRQHALVRYQYMPRLVRCAGMELARILATTYAISSPHVAVSPGQSLAAGPSSSIHPAQASNGLFLVRSFCVIRCMLGRIEHTLPTVSTFEPSHVSEPSFPSGL